MSPAAPRPRNPGGDPGRAAGGEAARRGHRAPQNRAAALRHAEPRHAAPPGTAAGGRRKQEPHG